MSNIIILGPSGAGKTCMLAALSFAALYTRTPRRSTGGYQCFLTNPNDAMEALIDLGQQMFQTGSLGAIPPNISIERMEFDLSTNLNRSAWEELFCLLHPWLISGHRSAHYAVLDTPGGWGMPTAGKTDAAREKIIVEAARNAEGLLLCLDSMDTEEAVLSGIFVALHRIFRRVGKRLNRLAIALTKAELLYSDQGKGAESSAQACDPWLQLGDLLANQSLAQLKECTEVLACGLVSTCGFTKEGEANFDKTTGKLLSYQDSYQVKTNKKKKSLVDRINSWRPYNLLDPFVFLLSGEAATLRACPF